MAVPRSHGVSLQEERTMDADHQDPMRRTLFHVHCVRPFAVFLFLVASFSCQKRNATGGIIGMMSQGLRYSVPFRE